MTLTPLKMSLLNRNNIYMTIKTDGHKAVYYRYIRYIVVMNEPSTPVSFIKTADKLVSFKSSN